MTSPPQRTGLHVDSRLVSAGRPKEAGAPLNEPIVPASNFRFGGAYVYSREDGTPTVRALEELLGELDGGHAVAFASGMAAAAAVFHRFGPGARIAIPADCYHGVADLAHDGERRLGWELVTIPNAATTDWQAAMAECDLVWLESPSNPLLDVADLPAICGARRKQGNLVCVDSTFATPLLQRPLEHGADVVMHSTTKFLGGHSDLVSGVLVARTRELQVDLQHIRTITGASPGALESYLLLRGVRTLSLRMRAGQANAEELARRLERHDAVERVLYPGLEQHATHEVARRTLEGPGAMLSFVLAADADRTDRFCTRLQLIQHATSLGGVESTLERRAAIEGQEHLPAGLVRMSVGCEHIEDLWNDLVQALDTTD